MAHCSTGAFCESRPLRIAIIGAGPAGLAASIALLRLPNVQVQVFEAARELREIGAGITLKENTWRLLKWYGAGKSLEGYYEERRVSDVEMDHRNAITNELLFRQYQRYTPDIPPPIRVHRSKLQNALLQEIPPGLIQLHKRLVDMHKTPSGISLRFEDGCMVEGIDFVVGADGIRSAVRKSTFPDHHVKYNGKLSHRVLLPKEKIEHIEGLPNGPTFWYAPRTQFYTAFLDEGRTFEIVAWAMVSADVANQVPSGHLAKTDDVIKYYSDCHPILFEALKQPDAYLQFPLSSGPRLESVISGGNIALIGDASHPLSGAYGAGAAFAFEDAFCLKEALEYARLRSKPLSYALELYDTTRSPHYEALYDILHVYGEIQRELEAADPPLEPNELVRRRRQQNAAAAPTAWIYEYNITNVWSERIAAEESKLQATGLFDLG